MVENARPAGHPPIGGFDARGGAPKNPRLGHPRYPRAVTPAARSALIERHVGLPRAAAAVLHPRVREHVELDELIAMGNLGLAEAAARRVAICAHTRRGRWLIRRRPSIIAPWTRYQAKVANAAPWPGS